MLSTLVDWKKEVSKACQKLSKKCVRSQKLYGSESRLLDQPQQRLVTKYWMMQYEQPEASPQMLVIKC